MAIDVTPLDFWAPDGNERVKDGENAIAHNAQTAQTLFASALGRLGQAEADIRGGLGDGPGLYEDPVNPGTYFMADASPLTEDPDEPGLYNF